MIEFIIVIIATLFLKRRFGVNFFYNSVANLT